MDLIEQTKDNDTDEISLKDLIANLKSAIGYLKLRWLIIVIFWLIGGALGVGYSFYKKTVYIAVSTFVLEEGNNSNGLSQYAGLASLAGIDLGGGNGGGIFQGDNILELYKSRVMIEQTLLSMVTIQGKSQLLIDRYIDFNGYRKKWKNKSINFNGDPSKFNRTQDSIITSFVNYFNKKLLTVSKKDKKLNIITVSVATPDELFSKEFNYRLVETVNDFYAKTKTKKSSQNVMVLQKQADSTRALLNQSLSGVASAIDASPNANPSLTMLRVASQRRQVDVQASSAVYSELIKNLELGKISLRQETPLIQVIDQPILPLEVKKSSLVICMIVGMILGAISSVAYLIIAKISGNLKHGAK